MCVICEDISKANTRKEIIKVKAETSEIENRKIIEQINETKSWFFEKINKIDKSLPRLIQKKREKTHITNISR